MIGAAVSGTEQEHVSTVWGKREKLGAMASRLAHAEAPELARDLRAATSALATAAREEIRQRAEQQTASADLAAVR